MARSRRVTLNANAIAQILAMSAIVFLALIVLGVAGPARAAGVKPPNASVVFSPTGS